MCDTAVALGSATIDGAVYFAKNSDRDANEAHELLVVQAADHAPGSKLKCTYIEIPQVEHTFRIFLAKPFWIWGAEMGANEHGVVIGNEAVFTKVPREKTEGLIGMDLLRLALERAVDAESALKVIIDLLQKHGQGGNCGFSHPFYYDNSFIIADRKEAWVLETAGRMWIAEKVKSVRSISNALTIGSQWDMISPDLIDYAMEHGWCKGGEDFDFTRCYSDFLYTRAGGGLPRQLCTSAVLKNNQGKLELTAFLQLLRTHASAVGPRKKGGRIQLQTRIDVKENPRWTPERGLIGAQVCMHTGWGPARESQSVGSMAVRLGEEGDEIWATGTSAPCTSIFKPIWLDAGLPDLGAAPEGTYDTQSLWWQHEVLHREVLQDYPRRMAAYSHLRDELERDFIAKAQAARKKSSAERFQLSEKCFDRANQVLVDWLRKVREVTPSRLPGLFYRLTWDKLNRRAKISLK